MGVTSKAKTDVVDTSAKIPATNQDFTFVYFILLSSLFVFKTLDSSATGVPKLPQVIKDTGSVKTQGF